jgi:hypothetical protein
VTLVGFFCAAVCAVPAGQVSISGADRGASLVQRDGVVIGRYIDDTYPGDPSVLAATFRAENVGLILVGSYQKPRSFGPGTTNIVEHYPVLDRNSIVTPPPPLPPGSGSGYVLQSFSWGDNLTDGMTRGRCTAIDTTAQCASRYTAPTVAQMTTTWCLARQTRAPVLLWFYYSPTTANQILKIESDGCAGWSAAQRSHRTAKRAAPVLRPRARYQSSTSWRAAR